MRSNLEPYAPPGQDTAALNGRAGSSPLPTLLDVPDACRELGGLSRAQIYRLLSAGELESVHIGRLLRVTSRSLLAYVDRLARAERDPATDDDGDR